VVIDKVNNNIIFIDSKIEVIFHPLTNTPYLLNEYLIEGMEITGIVFQKDGELDFLQKRTK